jgi:NTE family protein
VDPRGADLIVGTSAGALAAARLRLGSMPRDLLELAQYDGPDGSSRSFAVRGWRSPAELVRRTVGTSWVVSRAATRIPLQPLPPRFGRTFPGGLFELRDAESFDRRVPEAWPPGGIGLVAVDINTGRRVLLGRTTRNRRTPTLREAVRASCAVPGLYRPVRIGDWVLVDGGVHSSTNLDVVAASRPSVVVAVAPLAFDPARLPRFARSLTRLRFNEAVEREARVVRRAGAAVLLVRPGGDELKLHPVNFLRPDQDGAVADAAFRSTARLLETPAARRLLARAAWHPDQRTA